MINGFGLIIVDYRSASFITAEKECALSDMDRFSATARSAYTAGEGAEYFETNCVDDPVKMCDFQRTEGRILKTVDAVFQVRFHFYEDTVVVNDVNALLFLAVSHVHCTMIDS